MRLDQELVRRGLCESRQEAQECIEQGYVLLDNEVLLKKTRQVHENSILVVTKRRTFVSRGGEKLKGALLHIYSNKDAIVSNVQNKSAIDIGSSTGGFTDCLLSYNVSSVTAVDVGTSQLHKKLQNNSKVILFENTDIPDFQTTILFEIIVADLSFISLEKVATKIFSLGTTRAEYFILIKPQFEVGFGNTKKGIVKNEELIQEVLHKYSLLVSSMNFGIVNIFPCSITGGDGNQEYFLYAKK